MSQSDKARFYNLLKDAGYPLDRHYREYNTAELQAAYSQLRKDAEAAGQPLPSPPEPPRQPPKDSVPGDHAYRAGSDETVLYVDDEGRAWYREMFLKGDGARPRVRRRISYIDSGVVKRQSADGHFTETYEVAGTERNAREVFVTMPSYQVGIYKDPRYPWKIHVYDDRRGFDLNDIAEYFGGMTDVPASCKRIYVSNDLCFDMRSVIQTVRALARDLMLQKQQ